jgi:hypothetical protein
MQHPKRPKHRLTALLLAVATTLALGGALPGIAAADGPRLYGRVPAGGCITGIAVVVNGVPLCYVAG